MRRARVLQGLHGHIQVMGDGGLLKPRVPLLVLIDIALHHNERQGRAGGLWQGGGETEISVKGKRSNQNQSQNRAGETFRPGAGEKGGRAQTSGSGETGAQSVAADEGGRLDPGRPQGKGAGQGKPGKTREQRAAQNFEAGVSAAGQKRCRHKAGQQGRCQRAAREGCGSGTGVAPRLRRSVKSEEASKPAHAETGQAGIAGQIRGEQEHAGPGQFVAQAAYVVHGVDQPVQAGRMSGKAEQPAAEKSAFIRGGQGREQVQAQRKAQDQRGNVEKGIGLAEKHPQGAEADKRVSPP